MVFDQWNSASIGLKGMDSGASTPALVLFFFLTVWPRLSYLTSMYLNVPIYKMRKSQCSSLGGCDQNLENLVIVKTWNRAWHMVGAKYLLHGGPSGKEPTCQCMRCKRLGFVPWVGKIPQRKAWQPTPIFLPGESHEQRSLVGCSPQGRKESDTTEVTRMHTH